MKKTIAADEKQTHGKFTFPSIERGGEREIEFKRERTQIWDMEGKKNSICFLEKSNGVLLA